MKCLFFLPILFLFLSCGNKSRDRADLISTPVMTRVLWDMIQVDEFATANILKDTTKNIKIERIKLYQQVFKLHQVSEKEFAFSFKYYTGRPDLMKLMFDSLSAKSDRERRTMYMPKNTIPK